MAKLINIRIAQLPMSIDSKTSDVAAAAAAKLRIPAESIVSCKIRKQSLDARKGRELRYSYDVVVTIPAGLRLHGKKGTDWFVYEPVNFQPASGGTKELTSRPVIIGAGPAGLFAAYCLAQNGYQPIVIERGKSIDARNEDVERFFTTGVLDPNSNVQFGVGGAGAFSDGKLNTLIKDKDGRCAYVLETLVKFGAPEEITYKNKPHVGTDRLRGVVAAMQEEIVRLGGEFRTETTVTGFRFTDGRLTAVECGDKMVETTAAVLAIGHSARDTFYRLAEDGITMEPKAFAMGVRVQHKRDWVNRTQYGEYADKLPTADYKVTHTCENGRGVYSFCMCPGGYVVNASSEEGRLAINGMSNHARDAENSNAAIVVTVTPEDYAQYEASVPHPALAGVAYQRMLEEAAYKAGEGAIPTQKFSDFQAGRASTECGEITPVNKGAVHYTDLHQCLPAFMSESIGEGMLAFDRVMPGFADGDALLQAIESRTSSPLRIVRDDDLQAPKHRGLYPCGEGAGYAGGIMSAALDGIRVAEAIMREYAPIV